MTQQNPHPTQPPPQKPGQTEPPHPAQSHRPIEPVEPAEVLGRHKNSGQKDHKGAR